MAYEAGVGDKRVTWDFPWSFTEHFFVGGAFFFTGLSLDLVTDTLIIQKLQWPYTLIFFLSYSVLLIFICSIFRKSAWLRACTSSKSAVSGFFWFGLSASIMGLFPQERVSSHFLVTALSFNAVGRSWFFLFTVIYFLTILGLVVLTKTRTQYPRSLFFFLVHGGLWIALTAAFFGFHDIETRVMSLQKDTQVWYGIDSRGRRCEFDFSLKMLSFSIEKYVPQLMIQQKGNKKNAVQTLYCDSAKDYQCGDWMISIQQVLSFAIAKDSTYIFNNSIGSAPAALVAIKHRVSGFQHSFWVSCGSFLYPPTLYYTTDSSFFCAMAHPEPRKYVTTAELVTQKGPKQTVVFEVNKPVIIHGWKLYQTDYNKAMDTWSTISIITAIKDPWLPVVYCGILLLIAGSVVLFFTQPRNQLYA